MNQGKLKLILASASPRRSSLLKEMGCDFKVQAANIDESLSENEQALDYVLRIATTKVTSVYSELNSESIAVIGADTIVVHNGEIYGKPRDKESAFEMWSALSNCTHEVVTAVCLQSSNQTDQVLVTSKVVFKQITKSDMESYWASGEPKDKAGGYAIQGLASAWVKLINGSYSNVVGLPLYETNQLLKPISHNWL